MHFYPHHIGDYQRDTAHLSATDHGVYRLLMDHYYVTEKPLPGDIPTLCRIVRAVSKSERDSVMRVLASFFRASDVGFTHKRIEAEILEYRRKSEAAANAGKASGEARRAKRDANEKGTDVERTFDSRSHSVGHSVEPTSNHEPVTSSSFKKEAKENGFELTLDEPVTKEKLHPIPSAVREAFTKLNHSLNRRWTEKEVAAWRKLRLSEEDALRDIRLFVKTRAAGWVFHRKDTVTLLNNWSAEIERCEDFMRSVAPTGRYGGLNPQRGKV